MAVKKMSFEKAMSRIEEIVNVLENEEVSLEKSIQLFKEGTELSYLCDERLVEAENQIKLLQRDINGKLKESVFDIQEG